jgi:hypothetical protein
MTAAALIGKLHLTQTQFCHILQLLPLQYMNG